MERVVVSWHDGRLKSINRDTESLMVRAEECSEIIKVVERKLSRRYQFLENVIKT